MKLSLFSVSYAGLWGQQRLDLPDFLARAAQLGFEGVMLMGKRPHLSPLDVSDQSLASLRSALREHGVKCAVIAAYTDLSGAGAAEVPYLEMQIAYVQTLARVARQLDADIIRVFTAYEVEGQSPQAVWDRVVRALREICDRAAAENVTIAVQNHHDIAVHSDALLELLGDVGRPNCKLGFDAWSPALRGENLYETARQLAPHTAITTNADYVRLPRYRYRPEVVNYERAQPDLVRAVRFGEGSIDYRAFFQGLRDGGFNGWANYEMCSPIRGGGAAENLDAYASHYVRWMRDHVLKA
ncbi:MAG TPA: sugar phosphate isomerase/epimerase family protein [Candidatus Anammoximicrobium sp.]|nr:sugar phosphate isomerase/epimerase family protein [Candidatus Anammoximicrobium sp.]